MPRSGSSATFSQAGFTIISHLVPAGDTGDTHQLLVLLSAQWLQQQSKEVILERAEFRLHPESQARQVWIREGGC
jgi:hypothetical protein